MEAEAAACHVADVSRANRRNEQKLLSVVIVLANSLTARTTPDVPIMIVDSVSNCCDLPALSSWLVLSRPAVLMLIVLLPLLACPTTYS